MNIISLRKHIVDMDVVNDVTCTRQSVITRVDIRFFMLAEAILTNTHNVCFPVE